MISALFLLLGMVFVAASVAAYIFVDRPSPQTPLTAIAFTALAAAAHYIYPKPEPKPEPIPVEISLNTEEGTAVLLWPEDDK